MISTDLRSRRAIGSTEQSCRNFSGCEGRRYAGPASLSSDSWRLTFGLGSATRIEHVQVTWPIGAVEAVYDIQPVPRGFVSQDRGGAVSHRSCETAH